jgi:DNA primase
LYKKSQVLYGIDLARRDIAKQQQAVIVEGYTDVMACHLAGVTTAVATCGTSFGAEHIKVLRRLLMDEDQMRGHVVFTFDGDAAGQKAALRAFEEDQRFVSQTFVAVEKSGMDPCELRQAHGDAAVRELVESRSPLFEFAIRSILAAYNLETAEGRVGALQEAAPLVARIKDPSLRPEYARMLAGWLGIDVEEVRRSVERASRTKAAPARPTTGTGDSLPTPPPRPTVNARRDPGLTVEREALKAALQQPAAVSAWYESVEESSFTHPSGLAVHAAIMAAGSPSADVTGLAWVDAVLEAAHDDEVRGLVRELSVEPMPASAGQDARYAVGVIARLLEIDASRQITELKGRMQRADANSSEYQKLFAELMALTDYQRSLTQSHVDSA